MGNQELGCKEIKTSSTVFCSPWKAAIVKLIHHFCYLSPQLECKLYEDSDCACPMSPVLKAQGHIVGV